MRFPPETASAMPRNFRTDREGFYRAIALVTTTRGEELLTRYRSQTQEADHAESAEGPYPTHHRVVAAGLRRGHRHQRAHEQACHPAQAHLHRLRGTRRPDPERKASTPRAPEPVAQDPGGQTPARIPHGAGGLRRSPGKKDHGAGFRRANPGSRRPWCRVREAKPGVQDGGAETEGSGGVPSGMGSPAPGERSPALQDGITHPWG
jgi:hypothetical protein